MLNILYYIILYYIILYYNLMVPPSYMRSVVNRNVVMRRIPVYAALRKWHSTVDVVTRLRTDDRGTVILLRARITNLYPLQSVWTADKNGLVVK